MKKKKSIRRLAEKLKERRERPIPKAQMDEFNKIMEEAEPGLCCQIYLTQARK